MLQFDKVRVVGIFYDCSLPVFIIETQTGIDAMGAHVWLQHCEISLEKSRWKAAPTPSEMVLYELFKTYCMTAKEKEQTNAGS